VTGNGSFPILNYYDCDIQTNMDFAQGLEKSFGIYNSKILAWLELVLHQFDNSITGNTPTFTLKDCELRIEDGVYPWSNTNANIFTTPAKDLNVFVENTKFIIEPSFTRTSSSQKFFDINHLG